MNNNADDNIVIYDQFMAENLKKSSYPFLESWIKENIQTKIFLSIEVFRNPNISILEQVGLPSRYQLFSNEKCWYDMREYYVATCADPEWKITELDSTTYCKSLRVSRFEIRRSSSTLFIDQLFKKKISTFQYFVEKHFIDKKYSKYKIPYYAFSLYDFSQLDLNKYFEDKKSSAENSLQKIIKTYQPRGFESVNK